MRKPRLHRGKEEVKLMNKVILGILVVVIGGLAGWYVLNQDVPLMENLTGDTATPSAMPLQGTPTEDQAMLPEGSATVLYSESGFSPAVVRIKKGTAVTFKNQGAGNMWVASDMHPTHQLLPGFDALKSTGNGGEYTYTFSDIGTWTYHNHVNPTDTGTVVVTQ